MTALVQISETNGAGSGTPHQNVSNLNAGSNDSYEIVPATYPITVGTNAYHKMNRVEWVSGTANKIDNLQIWIDTGSGYKTGEGIQTNLRTSAYGGALTYSSNNPSQTTFTDQTMPTADPTAANLGIGGTLAGNLTAVGFSDYWKWQLQTTGSTPAGDANQKTFHIQYDEQ